MVQASVHAGEPLFRFLRGPSTTPASKALAKSSARPNLRLVQNDAPVPNLTPTPMAAPAPATAPAPNGVAPAATAGAEPVPAASCSAPLFNCVRVKDVCNIAPCAVPMVVMVKDPCWRCDPCNPCAAPPCVAVQVCVPPCSECPPRICCRGDGEYVSYDYGKYRVEITSRRGVVTVDYDD
jgi:hypothetical protein